jgi:FAD/FMN-containing dehydrogenase
VCLNDDGAVIDCRGLDRLIAFDEETGVLRCEAGVLLSEILDFAVPRGWFLPVTPGTQYVTVGGAIANDVHGKNHHRLGTFGAHVSRFELVRSDGSRLQCAPDENGDWYRATIGGLGLTGVVTWAEVALRSISSPYIDQEVIRYEHLKEFFSLSSASDASFEYTVAWIDCLARGSSLGRGLFIRGNHAGAVTDRAHRKATRRFSVPVTPPFSLVNRFSLRIMNALYYRKNLRRISRRRVHFAPFFYPLDAIREWNRVYGPKGFFQYQCAIPADAAEPATREILEKIAGAKMGSFLAVLKCLGGSPSPGLLSFPRAGVTLALDFPNRGRRTLDLLEDLDGTTRAAGGAVNPSKDARMSAESFQAFFPMWRELTPFIDRSFSSSFWRRVTSAVAET